MSVFALADLHLSFGVPEKSMEVFGPKWKDYQTKIHDNWISKVTAGDLVLIPGDISWAMKADRALIDLQWIDALPGLKVLLRGNHDQWWDSPSRVRKILPPSCRIIQHDAFDWNGISIGGARLWDCDEFSYKDYIQFTKPPREKNEKELEEDQRLFERELLRLEMSLKELNQSADHRIVMTHYPPIGPPIGPPAANSSNFDFAPTKVSTLLEKYHVDICVFGHLHNVLEKTLFFGMKNGVRYALTSADYLNFCPLKLL